MATKKVTPKNPEKKSETKTEADEKAESRKTAAFKMHRKTGTYRLK